jgi:hypothetical protein
VWNVELLLTNENVNVNIKPLQYSTDSIRDALNNDDTTNALQQLISTDVELHKNKIVSSG